jgi:hypothetical protein
LPILEACSSLLARASSNADSWSCGKPFTTQLTKGQNVVPSVSQVQTLKRQPFPAKPKSFENPLGSRIAEKHVSPEPVRSQAHRNPIKPCPAGSIDEPESCGPGVHEFGQIRQYVDGSVQQNDQQQAARARP